MVDHREFKSPNLAPDLQRSAERAERRTRWLWLALFLLLALAAVVVVLAR